ncbi:hypothetical protein AB0M92_29500 [Streptomyces sp. NPDC051582]|uniref:hypothetical protein n=1 Tax=Streptomyces sp. NPDC051582 TaxID=3155167 RepID=UPI00342587BE
MDVEEGATLQGMCTYDSNASERPGSNHLWGVGRDGDTVTLVLRQSYWGDPPVVPWKNTLRTAVKKLYWARGGGARGHTQERGMPRLADVRAPPPGASIKPTARAGCGNAGTAAPTPASVRPRGRWANVWLWTSHAAAGLIYEVRTRDHAGGLAGAGRRWGRHSTVQA